ncbi:2-hydroxyacid dehydrogenase [Shumkonia mesophila]|uniref:2-hydroxyacid dehydrogenase n=1 Tax=Shumkonia mesophila TaxID=2838854 RepID=UPI0029342AFE|nr:2-hydroxyacid dehydrogenase [Shumkonia mesophila]
MQTWKVNCLDVFVPAVRSEIEAVAPDGFHFRFAESYDRAEQMELAADADFLLVGTAPVDAEMIANAPKVKLIQKWGIGVDKIDLVAAKKAGIPVGITFGANAGPVAEQAILLMLAIYRRLPLVDRKMREGIWMKPELRSSCFQINGKTVGLIGFGNIGRMVAHRLRGFEAEILYYDPRRAHPVSERALGATYVSRDELLARSDIVSLHTPLTNETSNMINAETIAKMKDGAILVNTARGELVDEKALFDALSSGKLRGAGLDVLHDEPPSPDNPLLTLDQVTLTPHGGGGVFDNVENVARRALANMQLVLRDEPLAPDDAIVVVK